MIFGEIDPWLRLLFLVLLLSALMLRAGTALQWLKRRRERDGSKLAIALRSELAALLELYETNLRLIADDAGYLLSAKSLPLVYRANLQRLTLLHSTAIPSLVTVYARNERIEALLSVRHGAVQRREPHRTAPPRDIFQHEYLAGCTAITAALAALTPREEADASAGAAMDPDTSGSTARLPQPEATQAGR